MRLMDFLAERVFPSRETAHVQMPLGEDALPPALLIDTPQAGIAFLALPTPTETAVEVEVRGFIDGELTEPQVAPVEGGLIITLRREEQP